MIPLLGAIGSGIIYSIAGWKWSWMRSWLICPLILIAMILSKQSLLSLLYPCLLCGSWLIGYGYNSPLQTLFRKLGMADFPNKVLTRLINALAIAGCVLTLNHGFWFFVNLGVFVPLYVWLGVFNPCKSWLGIESARWEEFFIGSLSVITAFYLIW